MYANIKKVILQSTYNTTYFESFVFEPNRQNKFKSRLKFHRELFLGSGVDGGVCIKKNVPFSVVSLNPPILNRPANGVYNMRAYSPLTGRRPNWKTLKRPLKREKINRTKYWRTGREVEIQGWDVRNSKGFSTCENVSPRGRRAPRCALVRRNTLLRRSVSCCAPVAIEFSASSTEARTA